MSSDNDQTERRAAPPPETLARPAQPVGTLVRTEPVGTLVRPEASSGAAGEATQMRTAAAPARDDAPTQAAPTLEHTEIIQDRLVRTLVGKSRAAQGPLKPGEVIKDRFVLETMLGKGGMGVVFGAIDRRKEEARDPNPRVALKVLGAEFARHPQSFMALQREARKAQTLAHPNVVTVFDFDRDDDVVYMTMELLRGRSLDAIVREARGKGVDAKTALPIIRGVAEGLAYAHRKGIVHSDLKPGNVFIAEDGSPKILDFGIARAVPSATAEKDVFDAGELGAYTEAYATEEMVKGVDPHPADDMYALGIIAYELVTGSHPYSRNSAPSAKKLNLKFAPIKGLKRKQARAIESCLSFDRKRRPQDAGAFLKAFRGVTPLQQATLAAAAVLAVTAGYFAYQNYLETSPSIPFAQLAPDVQREFREQMQLGDQAWAIYDSVGDAPALSDDAINHYAAAWAIHPRNREAVAALNRTADELLRLAGDNDEHQRLIAQNLLARSEHFRKYAPVVDAAK